MYDVHTVHCPRGNPGAAEFLPVSSSGHLAIAQYYLSGFSQPGILFDVLLHLGTMIAVIIYFRRDVNALLTSPGIVQTKGKRIADSWMLILGSIPTGIIGLAGKDLAESLFQNMTVVGLSLLVTGVLLFICERYRTKGSGRTDISVADALITGTLQESQLFPASPAQDRLLLDSCYGASMAKPPPAFHSCSPCRPSSAQPCYH